MKITIIFFFWRKSDAKANDKKKGREKTLSKTTIVFAIVFRADHYKHNGGQK